MSTIYRFKVGDFECMIVTDGGASRPANEFFADIDADELRSAIADSPYDFDDLYLSNNILLIDTGEQRVLIDTGNGAFTGQSGELIANLAKENIQPASIDVVILTHAHADHFGAMLDEDGSKIFPNAQYFAWRDEWVYYSSDEQQQMEKDRSEERYEYYQKFFYQLESHLNLRDENNTEIVPGINYLYAPGHTKHHSAVWIQSGDEKLLYTSDALIHPIQFNNLHWYWAFEFDGEQLQATRRMLIDKVLSENAMITMYHAPFPGLGRITRDDEKITWQDA
ncbi:MAG: MBL fold metallo-hydrolase [Aggregatilineales bacterium]